MISLFLSLFLIFQPASNDTTSVDSEIESATVFLSGAQVQRNTTLTLRPGTNYIRFRGLSTSLNEETIQLRTDNHVVLESISKSNDKTMQGDDDKVEQLKSRKEQIQDSIKRQEAALGTLNKRLTFLTTNQDLSGSNTKISATEIRQAMDYFSQQFEEIENQRIEIEEQLAILREKLNKVTQEIRVIEMQTRRTSGVINLMVHSKQEQETTFNLSYFVPVARWYPSYDIRVGNTDQPLNLSYRANIQQNTGVDWNNVALTISSAEPRSDTSIPTIDPVYLDFYEPRKVKQKRASKASSQFNMQNLRTAGEAEISQVSGVVRDAASGEPLAGVNVYTPSISMGTSTDALGRYSMSVNPNAKLLRVTYIGYQTQNMPINSSHININLSPSSEGLNEIVVVGYGNTVESNIQQGQTAFSFEITNPYSIKSGAEEKTVPVESYTLPARYNYYAIPKERETALLTAKVTDWNSLNLLSGNANLFLEDSFVGKTEINPSAVDDTLTFSLGEDKGINIDRTQIEAFKEKNFFGNKVTETKGWEISIRNAKSSPVKINLLDQIPVASNEDIKVELTERSGANYNKSTGKLTWNIDLDAGESHTLRFVYEITYPNNKQLQQREN